MEFTPSLLDQALTTLGEILEERGLRYELVAVGGSSLIMLGLGIRATRDLDVVALVVGGQYQKADPLPEPLLQAARDVGANLGLAPDWLNPGPGSLMDLGLPKGFEERLRAHTFGGLVVHLAGRLDQICLKLYATVDQGLDSKHADDLRRLEPSEEELIFAARWAVTHDPSEGFRLGLHHVLQELGVDNA